MDTPVLLGRLHPLVLHFPIALLLVAAAVELWRLRWERPLYAQLTPFLLATGAVGALIASLTGWVFAAESAPRAEVRWMLAWHRWLGIATTVLAGVAAWIAVRNNSGTTAGARWARRLSNWTTAGLVSVAGHFGALLVWGEDHFDTAE